MWRASSKEEEEEEGGRASYQQSSDVAYIIKCETISAMITNRQYEEYQTYHNLI